MDWVVITICVALLLAVNVLWGVTYWRLVDSFTKALEAAARERQTLLDRIQAKDLVEYKTMTREPVPVVPKEPKEIITPL